MLKTYSSLCTALVCSFAYLNLVLFFAGFFEANGLYSWQDGDEAFFIPASLNRLSNQLNPGIFQTDNIEYYTSLSPGINEACSFSNLNVILN
jgi:hypothetical protein